ncbi:protein kinase domain-containing protein [Pyxidicoccus caerfyrddinensis]|uniref:protein kinase domain-containing protein n=1 Tax=Pyxidicoccus caerfyrddinensis TaxID=2709663 RepID=UPI001F07B8D7|nr:protein kinase [Pyxidicoccus caerfyrddinensis]
MGQVFRAWDEELQRVVALKFLMPPGTGETEEALVAMLRQEARAIAGLDHENIVRIFDIGEWRDAPGAPYVPYLVMECLEGESLGSLLKRERPGLLRTLSIFHCVARGLAHAHERSLIHRDLKPSNVFLTREGAVKLLDFGLAQLMDLGGAGVPHRPMAGTPAYMAPEQWRGEPQDARTDLWSMGVMLYEFLTGELPYAGPSLEKLRAGVIASEPVPSVRERAPEVPREVAQLVAALLEKEAPRRLSRAATLAEWLRRLEQQLGPWRAEPHALGTQYRKVTLVSCRLVGRSRLSERLDPEDALEMEEDFHRGCSQVILRHGGFVTHLLGDEVLACFGYPVAREDDSERAVRAGLDLQRYFREQPARGPGPSLRVAVGIHTDSMVFTVPSQGTPGAGPAIQGEAPRRASRLAEQAGPGGVVLGGTTRERVLGTFDTEPLDLPDSWRVLRERKAVTRFQRVLATGTLTRLVGRERELQALLGRWAEAQEGRGSFVFVSGEAGIGKSRLIQELLGRASPEPAFLFQAQCWEQLGSSTFAPVIELLWRLLQLEPRALQPWELKGQLLSRLEALGMLGDGRLESRHVDGLISLLSPAPAEEASPPMQPVDPQREERQKILEALRALLSRMTERGPVLAVLEDLHWSDPSTLELLEGLLGSVSRERLLVVLSARTGFQLPWAPRLGLHRLELGRLSEESAAHLVREAARERMLPEATVSQLVARTDCIPLFIVEMTRQALHCDPASIPVTLHELLASRLDALPPRQRLLLWFGAGVGRRFTRPLLAALTRRSEAELREDLEALVTAGILAQDDSSEPGYQFHHALLQEVAWGSLPRRRRREFHRHIAHVLEVRFPDVVDTRPEVLAHHYTAAGEKVVALRYRTRAVELAFQRWAILEAIDHVRHALALLRALPDASQRSAEEMQLLNALGISLMRTQGYDVPEIKQIHARTLELFDREGESLPYLDQLWMWLCNYFIVGGHLLPASELAERLLSLGRKREDAALTARAYRFLAIILRERGELVRSLELIDRARALSSEDMYLDAPIAPLYFESQVEDAIFICYMRLFLGDVQQAWRSGLAALTRARELNQPATLVYALIFLAGIARFQRDARHALEWAEEGMSLASRTGLKPMEQAARVLRGWAMAELGLRQEGVEVMRDALEQWRRMESWLFVPYFQSLLAEVLGSLGQVREGLASVEEALDAMKERGIRFLVPELHRTRGELLWLRGMHAEAMRCLLRARIEARRQRAALLELRATVSLSRLLRDQGKKEQARRRLVRACHGARVEPQAVDLQDARGLLEQLSPQLR